MSVIVASEPQRRASDPKASVWVAANAGSGKTYVLVDRVIRLMLGGTEPGKILCLTFTKAAASEMASRLFERLGKWIGLDDQALAAEIDGLGEEDTGHEALARARTLFTLAMETPGGIKIQTIHAFCERLLQLFPVEAGIVPGFEVMDERGAADTLEQARQAVLLQAESDPQTVAGQALRTIVSRVQADAFDRLLSELLRNRVLLKVLFGGAQGIEDAILVLRSGLSMASDETEASITADLAGVDVALYRSLLAVLQAGPKTNLNTAEKLKAILATPSDAARRDLLLETFLTRTTRAPRSLKTLVTEKLQQAQPRAAEAMAAEQQRVFAVLGKLSALDMLAATQALFILAAEIARGYEAAKRAHGRYDFEDLIARAWLLLSEQASAQWVLYKLDGGVDHILVDEAQDTSPAQWEIVRALAEEFFAGAGSRPGIRRTLFAVGDRKQSIFSFQGADPDAFDVAKRGFRQRIGAARQRFEEVPLTVSYRSAQDILDAVDQVFSTAVASQGLVMDVASWNRHTAVRAGQAGLIEIWPVEYKDDDEAPDAWTAPVDREPANHPRRKLARRIADTIATWLDSGRRLVPRGRAVRPGDILVLVRRRNSFVDALIRELRHRGIPVAGADRLQLGEHVAVEDLIAAARFAVQPDDDYTLACVLKGPLLARDDGAPIDDDDLFALTQAQGQRSLFATLEEAGAPYGEALLRLGDWRQSGPCLPPFEFFNRLLTRGRKRLLSRLGPEAADPAAALLDLACAYERLGAPSLPGFLAWFAGGETEIKRNMEQGADEVRIMTVHGAKGLEANIVFLPDTCDVIDGKTQSPLVETDEGLPFWRISGLIEPEPVSRWRLRQTQRAHDEYRRLLYVAMTRARDELYVCGYSTDDKLKPGSWYSLAWEALQPQAEEILDGEGAIAAWRIAGRQTGAVADRPEPLGMASAATVLPAWTGVTPPVEPATVRWLTPSKLVKVHRSALSPLDDAAQARLERGKAVHKLLQVLPGLPPGQRAIAARRFLLRHNLDQAIAAEVMAVIEYPDHAPYFAGGSMAEVPIAALIGETRDAIAGRIDRIAVTGETVFLVDFKTDRDPPAHLADADPGYLSQLALYSAALSRLFPDKAVRAGLLWTQGPSFMAVPQEVLSRQLDRGLA